MTRPIRPEESRTITVHYQAGPAHGLKFFPDQIYASAVSDWLPANDRPGERATLHLAIAAPPEMNVAASGRATSPTEWQLDTPTAPSWFGFAAGAFSENTAVADGVKLRVLGGLKSAELKSGDKQILEPTAAALHYLAERTGKPFPGQTYTQVFVHGDVTRSMAAGLTLLPETYAQELAKQPDHLRPLADALAHQWFGVAIQPKDWPDLWFADGIPAFLADTFLGRKFGKEAYDREIAHSRELYKQLAAEGKDTPLSDAEETTRQQKGAWFLYLANQLMGDNAFWDGLRLFTGAAWSQSATSEDLQRAFDAVNQKGAASGSRKNHKGGAKDSSTPLDNLFDMWVYGVLSPQSR